MARVLVLDPDPDLRGLAGESLDELGHEAVLPADAEAGAAVDVILLACVESRGGTRPAVDPRWAAHPCVCVADEPVAAERRCRPSAAYLVRPYTLEALADALAHVLTR